MGWGPVSGSEQVFLAVLVSALATLTFSALARLWPATRSEPPSVPLTEHLVALDDYAALLAHDVEQTGLLRQYAPQVAVRPLPRRRDGGLVEARRRHLRPHRALLFERLSEEDIRNAAFDLGLELNGSIGRGTLLRQLIEYLEDRGQEEALVAWLARCRPDIELE